MPVLLSPATAPAGDVIIARSPHNVKNLIVKRVIGLEGDTVHVQGRTWLGPPQTLVVSCMNARRMLAQVLASHALSKA